MCLLQGAIAGGMFLAIFLTGAFLLFIIIGIPMAMSFIRAFRNRRNKQPTDATGKNPPLLTSVFLSFLIVVAVFVILLLVFIFLFDKCNPSYGYGN